VFKQEMHETVALRAIWHAEVMHGSHSEEGKQKLDPKHLACKVDGQDAGQNIVALDIENSAWR